VVVLDHVTAQVPLTESVNCQNNKDFTCNKLRAYAVHTNKLESKIKPVGSYITQIKQLIENHHSYIN